MPPILWGFSFPSSRAWPGTIQFSEAICFRNVDDEDIKASSSWAPLLLHLLPSAAAAPPPPLPLPPLPPPPPPNVYLWTGSSSSIDRLCPPELLLVVNYYSIKFSRVMISFNEVIQIWKLSQLNRSLYQPESVRWWEGLQGLQDEYCQYEYSEEAMNNVWIEYRALQTKQNGEPKKKKRWNKIAPSGSLRSSRWETCNNGVHVDHLRGSFMCGFFTFSFSGRTCIFFLPLFHSNHSSFLDSQRLDAARGWEVQSILRPEWFRTGSNVITKTHITIRSETPVLTLKSVEAGKNAHTYLFTAANSWIFQDIFVSAVECRLVAVVSTIPELRASNWNLYFPGIEERDAQSKELSHRLGYLYSRETYPVGCGDIQSGGCHTVNCRVGRRCDFYRFLKEKIPETRTSNWKCVCVCVCVCLARRMRIQEMTHFDLKKEHKKKRWLLLQLKFSK